MKELDILLAEIKEDGFTVKAGYLYKDDEAIARLHYDSSSTSFCCGLHEYGNFQFYDKKLSSVTLPRDKESSLYKGFVAVALSAIINIYNNEQAKAEEKWDRNEDEDEDDHGETVAYGVMFTTN